MLMTNEKLKIIKTEEKETVRTSSSLTSRRNENEALFERRWLLNPSEFDPEKDCMGRERITRTWDLLIQTTHLKEKKIVDIGEGTGVFARKLHDAGASVLIIDIASNAIRYLKEKGLDQLGIMLSQDSLPKTKLADDAYDVVVCLDVIADLRPEDFRLAIAELCRIVKSSGFLICSTPLDIHAEDALPRFVELVTSEFKVHEWRLTYHALYLRLLDILKTPEFYYKSWKEKGYRDQELKKRRLLSKWWFQLNSSFLFAHFWKGMSILMSPLKHLLLQNRSLLLILEKTCNFLYGDNGVSHVIFIGQRRPLFESMPPRAERNLPDRPPFKKERMWE